MGQNKRRLFCEINPLCYAISIQKEICKRHIRNLFAKERFSKNKLRKTDFKKGGEKFPNIVSSRSVNMIKRAPGVNLEHQENKATNIKIASNKINGIVIHPGETFSFWKTVGKISKRNGYKEGRVLELQKLITGVGGGICNLANTFHWLVIHSPLEMTEYHKHSDALAPEEGKRVPLSAGISVAYNYLDYRFKNTSNQDFQLLAWCEGEMLHTQLRSEREIPHCYELVDEEHYFVKEGAKYYSITKIYRSMTERKTGKQIEKELIWDNHSEVMYDYALIPESKKRMKSQ